MNAQLTVVEYVYHHSSLDEQPTVSDVKFSRRIESDERTYERRIRVGEELMGLDVGWLEGKPIGMLSLKNLGPDARTTIPTAEQRAADESAVIQVLVRGEAFALIPPGESCRFMPSDIDAIRIKCLNGYARMKLMVFPG